MPDECPSQDYASPLEVNAAIKKLALQQWKDLQLFADYHCFVMAKHGFFDGEDVFGEVLEGLVTGTRRWSRSKNPSFVQGFMAAISSCRANRIAKMLRNRVFVFPHGTETQYKAACESAKKNKNNQGDLNWMHRSDSVERNAAEKEMFENGMTHFKDNPYCVAYLGCIYTHPYSTPQDMIVFLREKPELAMECGFQKDQIITAQGFSDAKRKVDHWVIQTYPHAHFTNQAGIDDEEESLGGDVDPSEQFKIEADFDMDESVVHAAHERNEML